MLSAAPAFTLDTKVSFTLNTTDAYGAPIQQSRYYRVTRPDGLARTQRAPMVLVFEAAANGGPGSVFRNKAAKPTVSIEEWRAANFGASVVNAESNPLDAGSIPSGALAGRSGRAGCPRRPVR